MTTIHKDTCEQCNSLVVVGRTCILCGKRFCVRCIDEWFDDGEKICKHCVLEELSDETGG